MAAKEYTFDKSKTYAFEEVRSMLMQLQRQRAQYLGLFYKHMPKELFDEVGKKAMFEYGLLKKVEEKDGKIETQVNFLVNAFQDVGTVIEAGSVDSQTENKAEFSMIGPCVLVEAWKEMGFSDEEVDYLCKIQSYGDYGQAEALGLKAEFTRTLTEAGCETCHLVVEKK